MTFKSFDVIEKIPIKEKLKMYLDKNDFNIPTFEDMVSFAQEIATEATKELEAQIEQMKCCQNCKNTWNGYRMNICEDCKRLEGQIFSNTLTSDNWELKEKR